jgi:hypothetical protein
MGIKDRLVAGAAKASSVARDTRQKQAENEIQSGAIDRLVVRLVRRVRNDQVSEHVSDRKLKKAAKRRNRWLAMVSLATGPFAGVTKQVMDLYGDTATVCELVTFHRLELTDEEIAAHMLVLWSVTDDLSTAIAAIEGRYDGGVMALASRRLNTQAGTYLPERRSPVALVKAIWQSRSLVADLTPKGSATGALMPGKSTRDLIGRAERQLGIERGRFGRLRRAQEPIADADEPRDGTPGPQLPQAQKDDLEAPLRDLQGPGTHDDHPVQELDRRGDLGDPIA